MMRSSVLKLSAKEILGAILALTVILSAPLWAAEGLDLSRLQLDMQGNSTYSRYNYTDLVDKYNSADSWMEFKAAYWLNEKKTVAPYVSIVPSFTSADPFWWQNNVQYNVGVQWYPFFEFGGAQFLKSVRAYAQYSGRSMYDKPDNTNFNDEDVQVGLDYYYDNIFAGNPMSISVWTSLAWYKTNFALEDYNGLISKGDVKFGPARRMGNSLIFPYASVTWTYSPRYEERWWENYLRVGAGVRFYPKVDGFKEETSSFMQGLVKRFHIFAEVLENVAWVQDDAPDSVDDTDYRVGIGFSSSGFFRE